MNKEEAICFLFDLIYKKNDKTVLTKSEIKYLEDIYKKQYLSFKDDILGFEKSNLKVSEIFKKVKHKGVYSEISKKLRDNEALQPGIITECVIAQSLAQLMGLKSFHDFESGGVLGIADIPKACFELVRQKRDTICAARYLYYNKNDADKFIIQYGNPKGSDISIIICLNEIIIEVKDMPALLGDKDLKYNDDGKIIITEEIKEIPIYVDIINDFNNKTSIIEEMGSNYPLLSINEDIATRNQFFNEFFEMSNIDILITMKKDELIAIRKEDIFYIFEDGEPLISTKGSEIRTTGKNNLPVFTETYLNNILQEKNIDVVEGLCYVEKSNQKVQGYKKGRGTTKITRFGINNSFFVRVEDIIEKDDYLIFPYKAIKQNKSGISVHIDIKKKKKNIKEALYS